jgi:hypothetical protein
VRQGTAKTRASCHSVINEDSREVGTAFPMEG